MDHSIRKLVWVSGLLAAGSFVYVLVFSPIPDPRARARSAGQGAGSAGTTITTIGVLDAEFRAAFAQCRFRSADRISREMTERYATRPESWFNRGIALQKMENHEEAAEAWGTLMGLLGSVPGGNSRAAARVEYYLGWSLRGIGELDKSVEHFARAIEFYEESLGGVEPARGDAYNLACYTALAGETERAIGYWERALSTGYPDPVFWWTMDPDLDPIRTDERFQELTRRYGFAE